MKKCFTLLCAFLAVSMTALAETEHLPLVAAGGAEVIDPNPPAVQNGLPARVTIPGNWGDVKLYNGSFDATTYVGCSVTLDEAPAEGTVQVYYRNADQAAAYSGTYVSWANSENAVVSEDGKTLTVTFDADALGEDLTITELALQNMGSSSVTVTIKEVLIYDEDENATPTNGLKATGWNPATIQEIKPVLYEADVQWNATTGYLGYFKGTVEEGTYHRVTFHTSEPLPEGFDAFCRNGSSADPEKIYMKREGRGTNAFTVCVPATYERLYLAYQGEAEVPFTIHFTGVEREVVEGSVEVEIEYPTKEVLPLLSDNGAEIVNPNINDENNGLPARVNIPGNWGDVKLYNGSFDATTYVACRVSLREAPAEGSVQLYYRNAEQAAAYSGTYVSWANSETAELSEDGRTLTLTFDTDALGEDMTITELALQNMGGSAVTVVIDRVYIIDEDENMLPTNGLKGTGWNPATFTSIAAHPGDPCFAGLVRFNAAECWLGNYSAEVAEGTYHRYTLVTDQPLGDDVQVVCQKEGQPVEVIEEGRGTDTLMIYINSSYDTFALRAAEAATECQVKLLLREAFLGQYVSHIPGVDKDAETVYATTYYDVTGMRIAQPRAGLYVVQQRRNDGKIRTSKALLK